MATSPNYGWLEPDNTDLLKNGALAIRTLGNAIDTTMATMTPKSIVDAKGDLIAASAADTPARLAVGNNGETLVADSSASTGLRYTGGTVQANPVLNSAFQVWQRGTSISLTASSSTTYLADRWATYTGANQACTVQRVVTNDTTNLPNIQYALRYQRNSGQTGTSPLVLAQSIENVNSIPFTGKPVSVSFYARAGANFSAASSALVFSLVSGTGTDQQVLSAFTGQATVATTTATLTTTWQRFTITGTVATTAIQLGVFSYYTPVGTASTNDYYEITGIQVDIGSVALPFRTYAGTIQGELAACQRYYTRFATPSGSSGVPVIGSGIASSTTAARIQFQLPVQMRVSAPSVLDYATLRLVDSVNAGGQDITALSVYDSNNLNIVLSATVASGLTQYRTFFIFSQSGQAGYLGISAEL